MSNCSAHHPPDRKLTMGLTDQQFCAADREGKQDTCSGDSGTGLQVKLLAFTRLHPFLVGVTSFGKSCGSDTPGVYSRIASYIKWLEQTTGESFDALHCAQKYAKFRELEPDVATRTRRKFGLYETVNEDRAHFEAVNFTHRADLGCGCGGVYIHEQYVLTSAACSKTNVSGERHKTLDLALVKLEKPLNFSDTHRPACLWDRDREFLPGEELEITGWGPAGVHSLEIPDNWVNASKTQYYAARASEISCSSQLCFGNLSQHLVPNTCQTDFGGPLGRQYYASSLKFHHFVMGINSQGSECGFGEPLVATKITSEVINWIDSVIFGKTPKEPNVPNCQKYRELRKPPSINSRTETSAHFVKLLEVDNCFGALISSENVLVPTNCSSDLSTPIALVMGDLYCKPHYVTAIKVQKLTETTSILTLKEPVSLTQCLAPICLWTDQNRTPFELTTLPDMNYAVACQTSEDGCASERTQNCLPHQPLQAIRNESGLVVPYLVGFSARESSCENGQQTLYFEKISSIIEKFDFDL